MEKKVITKKEDEFCIVTGVAGAALSITCLLQHLYFMHSLWITWAIAFVYVLSIICFILLVQKNRYAPVSIIVIAGLLFCDEILLLLLLTFSPVVLLLMLYSIIIAVLLYMDDIPVKLKAQYLASKIDDDFWKDKL